MSARRRPSALAGSCLLAGFMLIDGRLRRGQAARSWEAGQADKGTTAALGASFGVATLAGPALVGWRRGRLPDRVGWVGVAVMAAGLALRLGSALALGGSYTRTLRTHPGHALVQSGPYRVIRHPGYLGVLTMWLGYGMAWTSAPATLATTVPNAAAYLRRIRAEEAMLSASLGEEYRAYRQCTYRLLPGVY